MFCVVFCVSFVCVFCVSAVCECFVFVICVGGVCMCFVRECVYCGLFCVSVECVCFVVCFACVFPCAADSSETHTHRDNLSADSNWLVSGKCKILPICFGTSHTHTHTSTHTNTHYFSFQMTK